MLSLVSSLALEQSLPPWEAACIAIANNSNCQLPCGSEMPPNQALDTGLALCPGKSGAWLSRLYIQHALPTEGHQRQCTYNWTLLSAYLYRHELFLTSWHLSKRCLKHVVRDKGLMAPTVCQIAEEMTVTSSPTAQLILELLETKIGVKVPFRVLNHLKHELDGNT